MLEAIYTNASSLTTLMNWHQVVSQNLAAGSAAGYKRQLFAVESIDGPLQSNGIRNAPNRSMQLPAGTSGNDLQPGAIRSSDKKTDFAIGGPGYFQIQGPNGIYYTRNGEFHINAENTLVNAAGHPVLADGAPINIDPEEGPITVARDGTISQAGGIIGNLTIFQFDDEANNLTPIPGGFLPKNNAAPQPVENPTILQGAIENSNTTPIMEMLNLILISNAYAASQRIISTHDTIMGQAIQSLGTPPMTA